MRRGTDPRPEALLVAGPTGSGKTPLGLLLARRGFHGRPCRHFDFGEQLRAVAAGGNASLGGEEIAFVRQVLEQGALLENETFFIAEKVLRGFIEIQATDPNDLLILNGLPRHVGQAEATDRIATITAVLQLDCAPEVVLERLRSNSGGDRGQRTDDEPALVERKLRVFAGRTAPLLDYYRRRGVEVHRLRVGVASTPEDLLAQFERRWPYVQGLTDRPG